MVIIIQFIELKRRAIEKAIFKKKNSTECPKVTFLCLLHEILVI